MKLLDQLCGYMISGNKNINCQQCLANALFFFILTCVYVLIFYNHRKNYCMIQNILYYIISQL